MSTSQVISSRRTAGETGGHILRYTLSERIHHWLAAFTYIYCLITGLAFWSPYMYWLATLVGGGPTARFWHPWLGLGFTLSVFWMYKMWHRDMQTTDADRRWSKAIKYYIENEDEKLPPDRPLQLWPEIVLLADVLWRDPAGDFWPGAVVRGIHPVESALAAVSGGHGSRSRGAGDNRRLHHSCLHGHGHGPRRLHLDHSRRSYHDLGENPSPPLVRAGHQRDVAAEIKTPSRRRSDAKRLMSKHSGTRHQPVQNCFPPANVENSKEMSMTSGKSNGIIDKRSNHSVDETVEKLKGILQAKGVSLFALVDHSGEAEKAGLKMRPTKLLIFGSPKAGTPLMLAAPSVAIDLPLKILIWEDGQGAVWLSYNSPAYLQERHGFPPDLLPNISGVEQLAAAAAQ